MNLKLIPIRRALARKNSSFAEKRWKTSVNMGFKIEKNNRRLCKELNEFYRDILSDGSNYHMIKGKLYLISPYQAEELNDATARKLIQNMCQGDKDKHLIAEI